MNDGGRTWAAVEAVVECLLVDGLLLPQRLGPAQSAGFHLGREDGGASLDQLYYYTNNNNSSMVLCRTGMHAVGC